MSSTLLAGPASFDRGIDEIREAFERHDVAAVFIQGGLLRGIPATPGNIHQLNKLLDCGAAKLIVRLHVKTDQRKLPATIAHSIASVLLRPTYAILSDIELLAIDTSVGLEKVSAELARVRAAVANVPRLAQAIEVAIGNISCAEHVKPALVKVAA
jgi:hypothetical protein